MISDAVFRAREAGESRMMDGQHRNEVNSFARQLRIAIS